MRAVLDPNALISALLTPAGSPAAALRAWLGGALELIVSPLVLQELTRALGYPKLRRRIDAEQAARFVDLLSEGATVTDDPSDTPAVRSGDPDDDYLIALAARERALLVSGDGHLLEFEGRIPVLTPAAFIQRLGEAR